jgi:hypothetical protein
MHVETDLQTERRVGPVDERILTDRVAAVREGG